MNSLHSSNSLCTPQDALVAAMAGLSLSEFELKVSELADIESIVKHLPAFANYDSARIRAVAGSVRELLDEDEGMEALCGMIKQALPPGLSKTAYAVCCDVPATGAFKRQRELSFLLHSSNSLRTSPGS